MRVCLINPPRIHPKAWGKPNIFQPINIAYVAALLERQHKIHIIDAANEDLKNLEQELKAAIDAQDAEKYQETTEKIRKIGGNMNLSNVFFGGFKTPIEGKDNFEDYKSQIFEVVEGSYKNGLIEFNLDPKGIITEIKIKEGT